MQGIKRTSNTLYSAEKALYEGTEADFLRAILVKYAHVIDECDSARDIKPLATGACEILDRLKSISAVEGSVSESSPLSVILGKAS